MIECDSWEQLTKEAQNACNDILENDVAPVAEKILKDHIKSDIYSPSVYTPKPNGWVIRVGKKGGKYVWEKATYKRRNKLSEKVMSKMEDKKHGVLSISSKEKPMNPIIGRFKYVKRLQYGSLLYLLESDNMGRWRGGFPRPALTNAANEMASSPKIDNKIEAGMRKRGLK